jgi:broad specificity phosphatase PhoE
LRQVAGDHNKARRETGDDEEYKNWAWFDSRLTEVGKEQARALRPEMELPGNAVEVVLVSSLSRAILTGILAFPGDGKDPPFEALDMLRERIGTHPCDKRRPKTEIAVDFPTVDLSDLTFEEDEKWTAEREHVRDLIHRANNLLPFVKARKEHAIGICSHNDFLTAVFFDSVLRFKDEALRVKFGNAEHHPLVIRWTEAETDTGSARVDTPMSAAAEASSPSASS